MLAKINTIPKVDSNGIFLKVYISIHKLENRKNKGVMGYDQTL